MPFKNTLIDDEKFWPMMKLLEELESPCLLDDFLKELSISEERFIEMLSFLDYFNFEVTIYKLDNNKYIKPPAQEKKVEFEMTFSEWLSFQAHFPRIAQESKKPYHPALAEKLKGVEKENPDWDLFKAIDEIHEKNHTLATLGAVDSTIITDIEMSLENKSMIDLKMFDGKTISTHIHRLLYLDGGLSVVAEEVNDRCLIFFRISDVESCSLDQESVYKPNFSSVEVNDFILAMRAVTGKEERLVLKIKSEEVDLNPEYHFLANCYVTTNPNGDKIWAASVEVSDELYAWLYDIREHIEIMDPTSVQDEFLAYCAFIEDQTNLKSAA